MILDFFPVINALIILGSMLLLGRTIAQIFKKDREFIRTREAQILRMVEKAGSVVSEVRDTTQLIVNYQKSFDDNMNVFSKFIDNYTKSVTLQYEQFNASAKADMLAARREELLRTKELKAALERLMGVALTSRQPPSPNDVLALENLDKRIEELETILE